MNLSLAPDTPQANYNTAEPREECHVVGGAVADETIGALAVALVANNGVAIVHCAVDEVEHVATKHWGQSHGSPVLGQTAYTKGVSGKGREDTEQETVGNTRHGGDDDEGVRVGDGSAGELGHGEDEGGDEETPEAGHVELLNEDIGANAAKETARKVTERQDGDMHNLALLDELRCRAVVVV